MKKLLSITLSLLMSISLCCTITADEGTDNNSDGTTTVEQTENVEEKQETEVVTDNQEDGSVEVEEQKQEEVTTPAQPADSGVSKDETSTENKDTIDSETTKDEYKGTETIPAVSEEHEGEGSGEAEKTPSTLDTEKTDDETKDSEDLTEDKEETIDLNNLSPDELFEYLMANVKDNDQLDALYEEYPNLNELLSNLTDEQVDEFFAMLYGDGSNELPSNGEDDISLANEEEVKEEKTVAKIGNKGYETLQKAIDAVTDNNETTIVLQSNVSIGTIKIDNKNIILDASGKEIKQDFSQYSDANSYESLIHVLNGGKLTIKGNGTFVGPSGDDAAKFDDKVLIRVSGQGTILKIIDGTFTCGGKEEKGLHGIFPNDGAKVILGDENTKTGPTITSHKAAISFNNLKPASSTTVYGGKYESQMSPENNGTPYYDCAAIYASATGDINIYGGTFSGYYGISSRYSNVTQNITISGGSFDGKKVSLLVENINGSGPQGTGTRTISISSGTFSSDVSEYLASGYNVVKKDGSYQVVSKDTTVPVTDTTAAVSDDARNKINNAASSNTIKDASGNTVTVNASTQIKLESSKKELTTEETNKVETAKTEVVNKLKIDTTKEEIKTIPLDITLTAINDGTSTKITDLGDGNAITVTLYLNDATTNALKGKTVKVIRIHGNDTDVLDATLTNNTLTFKTSKFSTYVLAYAENKPEEPKQESIKSYDAKDKNRDGIISCAEEMNSANWTWSETKKACVYRVTNTGAK